MRTRLLAVLLMGVAAIVGCGDDDGNNASPDSGVDRDSGKVDGVCNPAECPTPINGVACCLPDARCGSDPGFGMCIANSDQPPANTCDLDECDVPPTGVACCLSNGKCGRDPWELGVCFPNPPRQNEDAGGPTCDLSECDSPDEGIACCMPSGRCGVDLLGLGFCALATDGGVTDPTEPPNDPSITGECPSYLGAGNIPVWGCCSRFGVCGTFAYDMCLLAPGTQIPVPANDGEDAGIPGLCTPPVAE